MVIPLCFGTQGQNLHATSDEYNGFVLVELYQYLIMVIDWVECNLVWNHTRDFKIERARGASSIWNHKEWIKNGRYMWLV